MMIIRPVHSDDWAALRELSRQTGPGFTSMQDSDEQVQQMIEAGADAFKTEACTANACTGNDCTGNNEPSGALATDQVQPNPYYLFVLEETTTGRLVGTSAIQGAVGLDDVWYSYRLGTEIQASKALGVYRKLHTLTISNDQTGCSEICTLFLMPEYRRHTNGHLLAKARFMFMADYPERFSETIIAEMRGCSDAHGISPFWEGLGRHFFAIDFTQADKLSTRNKVFIAELMPKHAIYTHLLPESAQAVIGQTQEATRPARRLLESEGFRYNHYVDIFDAGPMLEAPRDAIRTVRHSQRGRVQIKSHCDTQSAPYLISNTHFASFRCTASEQLTFEGEDIILPPETAHTLCLSNGDPVRVAPLWSPQTQR